VKPKPPAAATLLAAPAATTTSLAAPPPPSAEEWKLASTYTLKNGKRYRHAWGQQVRSMMGTALAGPDQGQVRFRITIAPDGSVAQVEELWSTSEKASKLAWKAIRKLPPLPPTPTGKPLIFEQTISFLPYETGWPPSYKQDCLPDPPVFRNPFAWDGQSAPPGPPVADSPQEMEAAPQAECDPTSTASTIEEEEKELARQMNQNRWGR
jgi:TonB family protein